ncbi:PEP-CTERM sorting domain-containing protein [Eleftheria terrae]|uniref:PEP-CTERM sorting domain-containing protein n=1 Tax=Eleftheria terrae TaxID=1597781 RepID=UPI00263BD70C|nr:PEP-CTERM sorting domain-containing protein [Eleftheria terrae]WKB54818.1 PEP-CTERM sorting domain-containing protein [Eleftheria terrae]
MSYSSCLRSAPRLAAIALAAQAALAPALAADRIWNGGAGTDSPYWDLTSNWLDGPPANVADRAVLGSFDSLLRDGVFSAFSVHGSGKLMMSGGQLNLGGGASSLAALDLRGGWLRPLADSSLTLGSLNWSGGSLGDADDFDSINHTLKVVVNGRADLQAGAGGLTSNRGLDLELNGQTFWHGGDFRPYLSKVTIGAGGTFHDHAASGRYRELDVFFSDLVNNGHYLKTGSHSTVLRTQANLFLNAGTITVKSGQLDISPYPNGDFQSTGTINVDGGTLTVSSGKGETSNQVDGAVNVRGGTMFAGNVYGSARWQVAAGAKLNIGVGSGFTGSIHNDGTLRLQGHLADASRLSSRRGRVEVIDGGELTVKGQLEVGSLEVGRSTFFDGGRQNSRLSLDGSAVVGDLDWGNGYLDTTGTMVVTGNARLHGVADYWEGWGPDIYGKRIDGTMEFRGKADWEGDAADLFGKGRILVAEQGIFEDRNALGNRDPSTDQPRPTEIRVARFDNAGTFLKTGVGATDVQSAFNNQGRIQVTSGSGTLRFLGALDNAGSLEAVRSRVLVAGALKQWDAATQRLTGGGWVVRDGTLALNLGKVDGEAAGIRDNAGRIVLDGRAAKLVNIVDGQEVAALGRLNRNTGDIGLQNQASLSTSGDLLNEGAVRLESGNTTWNVWGDYTQRGAASATWVDGTLQAKRFQLEGGTLGAGGKDTVGAGQLAGDVNFAGTVLDVDIASLASFDVLTIDGQVSYGGTLQVDFLGTPVLGSYKVVDVSYFHSGSGSFDQIVSNLDSRYYRLDVEYLYGDLTLTVAAVPEPGTYALMGLGLGALAWAQRRRSRGQAAA